MKESAPDKKKFFNKKNIKVVALSAGLALGANALMPKNYEPILSEMDSNPELTVKETKSIARNLNNIINAIPPELQIGIKSQEELIYWTLEIVPQFEKEKMVNKSIFPEKISFTYFGSDSRLFSNVAGLTYCEAKEVEINDRYINPVSAWLGDGGSIQTAAHELAHVQGVCSGDIQKDETIAQIMSLEVLSAMYNKGNKKVAYSIYDSLRYMALMSLKYDSLTGKMTPDDYLKFRNEIFTDRLVQAGFDKSDRDMPKDKAGLKDLSKSLYRYYKKPLELIMGNLDKENINLNSLGARKNQTDKNIELSKTIFSSSFHNDNNLPPMKINDLAYVIRYSHALVPSLNKDKPYFQQLREWILR